MNRPTRYFSKSQEKRVARQLGGKRQPNSGATAFYKGDVITDEFLIECKTKTTNCKSFTIKEDWLLKNEEEAFAMARHPALCFDFGPSANKRYYIISERQFGLLQQCLEEGRI